MREQSTRYDGAALGALPTREQLRKILASLEAGLVERGLALRLALLAALAGEHTLLVGPPGTAKSQLARRLHLAFADSRYFERLLTRYTVPEELFGPLSIKALEEDRYERQTDGFLPQASIAFIDEVFKASSAILNALLTLLNEREFDNGPRRELCPLISVIGATNAVPDDELGEAFLDRFLVRLTVAPVSSGAFAALLDLDAQPLAPLAPALAASECDAVWHAAREVHLGEDVAALLGEARAYLAREGLYVSDRRWVKIAWLLKVTAATEERTEVSLWDLWLVPWCTAADGARQASVAAWLAARLGIQGCSSPPRLTRAVEAFEAQLEGERRADELDYDERERLTFGAGAPNEATVGGKRTVPAVATRRRRYGAAHIGARLRELDDLARRVDRYRTELSARRGELARHHERALWMDEDFARRTDEAVASTVEAVRALADRVRVARDGFEALPRLADDPGTVPAPVAHELLAG